MKTRKKARTAEACPLCPARIRPGAWIAKDFELGIWVHVGCLLRKRSAVET